MKNQILPLCFVLCLFSVSAFARTATTDSLHIKPKLKKFYVGTGTDAGIFSTATIQHPSGFTGKTNNMGTLRFSYFLNLGVTFNFNLSRHIGLYTGVDLKNVGYIENGNGETVKRRTYNIGAPIGIKIGNMRPKKRYLFLGGGVDVPINYKEKSFEIRSEKKKLNEWFSQRTPAVMPYVFAGVALNHGITLKAQYYPNNFMNPDFTTNGIQPYAGTEVHLMLLSVGYWVPAYGNRGMMKKHIADLKAKADAKS